MDFSIPFHAITKVRRPSRGHVISQDVFFHFPKVGHTERWVKSPHWKFVFVDFFILSKAKTIKHIWCDFDLASSLICGNKMPTRCNRGFYCRSYWLLNMFRAPLCPSSGCCSILQTGHITFSSTPDQEFEKHSTKYHRQQPLYNTLELLMMGVVVPETCWASNKICNKNLCCL